MIKYIHINYLLDKQEFWYPKVVLFDQLKKIEIDHPLVTFPNTLLYYLKIEISFNFKYQKKKKYFYCLKN